MKGETRSRKYAQKSSEINRSLAKIWQIWAYSKDKMDFILAGAELSELRQNLMTSSSF